MNKNDQPIENFDFQQSKNKQYFFFYERKVKMIEISDTHLGEDICLATYLNK
jgi:hypothetical protein